MKPENIRLLVCAPNYPPPVLGGLEKQASLLNGALHGRLGSVVVLSNTHGEETQSTDTVVDGIRVVRANWMKGRALGRLWNLIHVIWHLIFWRKRYDVVHVHNLSTYACCVAAVCHWIGRPCLVKLPNVGRLGVPGICSGKFGGLRKWLFRKAAAYVAMSETSVQELKSIKIPETRILKVVNGIDLKAFDKAAAKGTDLSRPREGVVRFVFTGRLMPQKGLDDLLGAWKAAGMDPVNTELWIVGKGREEDRLRKRVAEEGFSENVRFLGYRADVPAILAAADVFVLPSYSEGNSNAILEAMAAALPIITTDVGGSRLLVGDCGQSFVIQPGDQEGLAKLLTRTAVSDEDCTQLGLAMRKRVEAAFDLEVVAEIYANAYAEMQSSGASSGVDLQAVGSALFNEELSKRAIPET
jgi:glycosyltransferase involved in cell wall biosynthesis